VHDPEANYEVRNRNQGRVRCSSAYA
jgi:hypothetical protein